MVNEMNEGDILAVNGARADFYRFLSGLLLHELTQEQIDALAVADLVAEGELGEGYALMQSHLRHRDTGTRQELACDYARVFLGAGNYDSITAPPYESVYTSPERLLMQEARDQVVSCYRAEGLDLPAENTTPEDHAGFELQFMALLAERSNEALEAGDLNRFAELVARQTTFFDGHLAVWLPEFAADVERFSTTGLYRGVSHLLRGLVASETEVLADLRLFAGAAA